MSLLLALAAGCGTVSNGPFDDDADFLAALPSEERQTLSLAEDASATAGRGIGERAELVELSVGVASTVNGFVFGVLNLLDGVRSLPPTSRTEDGRRWGPAELDCNVDGSLLMIREASVYDWSVVGHQAGEEADSTVLYGTHFGGSTVEAGDGVFVWDHTRWSSWCGVDEGGLVSVQYDNRDGVDLLVALDDFYREGEAPADRGYAYRRTPELGDFEYRTEADLDGSGEAASVEVRDRWEPGVGGRSDARVTGGRFGDETWEWSQCWGATGALVYEVDNLGVVDEAGSAADCVFADAAGLERI